jgi:cytochrome c-type biogenesis protein CcmH/NrfG
VLVSGGFIWDDDRYITENAALRSFAGLIQIWIHPGATVQYYPLTFTSFWIEYHLWGLHAGGYHLVNVLLHAVNSILLWRTLRYLGLGPVALVTAILFAVHPIQVESVAWITERKNLLSALFYLLSAQAYLRWVDLPQRASPLYAKSLAFFLAALLSKTVACSLPAALLLVSWWKQRWRWQEVLWLSPMFILGLGFSRVTAWMEVWSVGAQGSEFDYSIGDRVIIAGRAIWFYAAKLLWPDPLIFSYPRWSLNDRDPWQYAPMAGVVGVLLVAFFLRQKIGRGVLTGLLFFIGTLVPALGFVNIYPMRFSFVADHFQYLASVGVLALVAAAIVRLPGLQVTIASGSEPKRFPITKSALAFVAALVLVLGSLTLQQGRIYQNTETIWRDTFRKNDQSWMAIYNLGLIENRQGNAAKATELFQRALAIKPDDWMIHGTLGLEAIKRGDQKSAESHFRKSIRIRPDNFVALQNLALLLYLQGDNEQSLKYAREAVRISPEWCDGHLTLGQTLMALNRQQEALTEVQEALRLDPSSEKAKRMLARFQSGALPKPD